MKICKFWIYILLLLSSSQIIKKHKTCIIIKVVKTLQILFYIFAACNFANTKFRPGWSFFITIAIWTLKNMKPCLWSNARIQLTFLLVTWRFNWLFSSPARQFRGPGLHLIFILNPSPTKSSTKLKFVKHTYFAKYVVRATFTRATMAEDVDRFLWCYLHHSDTAACSSTIKINIFTFSTLLYISIREKKLSVSAPSNFFSVVHFLFNCCNNKTNMISWKVVAVLS